MERLGLEYYSEGAEGFWCGGGYWQAKGRLPEKWCWKSANPCKGPALTSLLRQRQALAKAAPEAPQCWLDDVETPDGQGTYIRRIRCRQNPGRIVNADHFEALCRILEDSGRQAASYRLALDSNLLAVLDEDDKLVGYCVTVDHIT